MKSSEVNCLAMDLVQIIKEQAAPLIANVSGLTNEKAYWDHSPTVSLEVSKGSCSR